MFNAESDVVEDVISLRNQLRLTEKNLQTLGAQLSHSENDCIAEHRAGSGSDEFPGHLTLEDLQKPNAVKALSYPGSLERDVSGEWSTKAHSSDCGCHSSRRGMENEANEASQLRRKVASIREENSSLVLENRQLISDLQAAQLELASSKSKLRLLGSSIGAKTSNVSLMKNQIQDLESQLETQAKALRDAEHKLGASEHTVVQKVRALEKLQEELNEVELELGDARKQCKRTEQQRNQALRNAEKLSATFKDYKAEVAGKLQKVMESESKLKASLIECDREREELENRCTELEREREEAAQKLSRELKEAGERANSLATERLELQDRLQQASQQLGCLQKELDQQGAQLDELAALRREREDLRLLTACQEQRLLQAQREMENSRAEVASLENILDMLHLRENRDGALCVNPCLLPSLNYTATTEQLRHNPGERYQKLLVVVQSAQKEKERQASAAQALQERLTRAQEEISSLQATIAQRASHYQQVHSQLLDKAAKAATLEKEMKKTNSRVAMLEKQLQEKTAAYSQAAIRNSKLEQELLEKDSSIHHYQSVLNKRQREHLQAMEISKMAETKKYQDLEDQIEGLQLSLSQRQDEVKELKKSMSALKAEKQEYQHQACLLQTSLDQLNQDIELSTRQRQEEIRSFEEQALESASKVKFLETELACCKEELSGCLQKMEKVKQQYETQLELNNSEVCLPLHLYPIYGTLHH